MSTKTTQTTHYPQDISCSMGMVIRQNWDHFLRPIEADHVSIMPFLLIHLGKEWFTRYPKRFPNDVCSDEYDIEFHVISLRRINAKKHFCFTTESRFCLRYGLSQIRDIMPRGTNAYEIIPVDNLNDYDAKHVSVRFYDADVDMSHRILRTAELVAILNNGTQYGTQ